jgi:hypothetical protein
VWLLGCFFAKKPESDDQEATTQFWTSQEASTKKPLWLLGTGFLIKWLLDYEPKHSNISCLLCLEKPYSEQSIRKVETIALK